MIDFTFITGNQNKADYLAKWLEMPLEHQKLELDEIQSLDAREVAEHKVRQAYAAINKPVLVEDVALTFVAMGRLPGTLIKWFLEELDTAGLCKLASGLPNRQALASIIYALYDGHEIHYFEAEQPGAISPKPKGNLDFGWNPVFIPDGANKTYAQMTDDELKPFSFRAKAIAQLKTYLTNS